MLLAIFKRSCMIGKMKEVKVKEKNYKPKIVKYQKTSIVHGNVDQVKISCKRYF